jgi:hypothetical protein
VALVAVVVGFLRPRTEFLLSIGVYVSAALLAYALETAGGRVQAHAFWVNLGFGLVALGIGLLLRFTSRRVFVLNPLDFLIVLLALLVPPVLRQINPEVAIGGFMLKFVVIAYAGEILLSRDPLDRRLIAADPLDRRLIAAGAVGGTLLLGLGAVL